MAIHKDMLREALQLLIVLSPTSSSTGGELHRFERERPEGEWRRVESPIPITLGESGWASPEEKREGDRKSPMGIYPLGPAFGYASFPDCKMSYVECTEDLLCVDDPDSRFYNRFVSRRALDRDWKSAEEMKRQDELYKYGLVIRYNEENPLPGRGSCIFMHVGHRPTAGCIAMEEIAMRDLLLWLEEEKRPHLVQMHREEYSRQAQEQSSLPLLF